MKKLLALVLVLILNCQLLMVNTFAEEVDTDLLDPYVGDDLSLGRCLYKGNTDFLIFTNSIIINDGFVEGVIEPFNDIFLRNQCQTNDIMSLVRQRDTIRSYIREAFLTCKTERLPYLRSAYHKVNAEIYYVRHVTSKSLAVNLPFSAISTQLLYDEDSLFTPTSILKRDMRARYVKKDIMNGVEFEAFFNRLTIKYEERKKSYATCESTAWDEVQTAWSDFIDSAGGTIPAWNSLTRGVGGRAEKIVEAATDMGLKDYFSGIFQVRLNGLSPADGFDEIIEQMATYLPPSYDLTQADVFSAVRDSGKIYDKLLLKSELSTEFELLYKETGGATVELFVGELNKLNGSIEQSFGLIEGMENCADTMDSRQCQ